MSIQETFVKALRSRDYAAAEEALNKGADINYVDPVTLITPFHDFMTGGDMEQGRWLAGHGANINAVDRLGDTVLMQLIERNRIHEFKVALELGVDIHRANDRSVSPVLRASLFKHGLPFLRDLLAAGASPSGASLSGTTPIMAAVTDDYMEMASLLFEHGADPRGVDEHGNTIFYSAVMSGNPKMLKLVLEKTQDLREKGEMSVDLAAADGSKPIALAASNHSPEMVLLLLRAGADPNAQSKNMVDSGVAPLMVLAMADAAGDAALVKEALAAGAKYTLRDRNGRNVIYYAILDGLDGKREVFEALIEAGLDPRSPTSPDAVSPLHIALRYEQPEDAEGNLFGPSRSQVLEVLMKMGFPSLPLAWTLGTAKDVVAAPPPLVLALANRDMDSARVLLEFGTPPNTLDERGVSVLHKMAPVTGLSKEEQVAIQFSQGQVEKMTDVGAAAAAASQKADADSPRAKQAAAKAEKIRAQTANLIEKVEEIEAKGRGLVSLAADWLTRHGADWNLRSQDGRTPAMAMAQEDGYLMIGQVARFHGADLTLQDPQGFTAADYAFSKGCSRTLQAIIGFFEKSPEGYEPIKNLILNAVYASPEIEPSDQDSYAARASFLDRLSCIPKDPIFLEAKDENGNTALTIAAATGQDDVVRLLLGMGADPNARNLAGETPLLHATSNKEADAVRLLRAAGGDPDLASATGVRPRDLASAKTARMASALNSADLAEKPEMELSEKTVKILSAARRAWDKLSPATEEMTHVMQRRRLGM